MLVSAITDCCEVTDGLACAGEAGFGGTRRDISGRDKGLEAAGCDDGRRLKGIRIPFGVPFRGGFRPAPAPDQIGDGGVDQQRDRGPTLGREVRRAVKQTSLTECRLLGGYCCKTPSIENLGNIDSSLRSPQQE